MKHRRGRAASAVLAAPSCFPALALLFGLAFGTSAAANPAETPVAANWATLAAARPADAPPSRVVAHVDLSDQTMMVYVDHVLVHTFAVSTGRGSYRTPTGTWKAGWLASKWRSRKYGGAPMPWSVFFYKGYAVHGTTALKSLGRPASHGCVRLHPDNAKIFYKLVEAAGKQNAIVNIVE